MDDDSDVDHDPRTDSADSNYGGVEADAVCEQCEMVNPPETRFCQGCGADLRAQHARRLDRFGTIEIVEDRIQPIRVLTGLIAVLGALLCIWVALNVDTIVNWMAQGFADPAGGREIPPRDFWEGAEAASFNPLASELRGNPVTRSEINAGGVGVDDGFVGRYFIQPVTQFGQAPVIGYAVVDEHEDGLRLVAQFGHRVEIRAYLERRGDVLISTNAAVRTDDGYVAAMGYAEPQPDGALLCSGQTVIDERFYQVFAYRAP